MTTKLEQAKTKLDRIQNEQEENAKRIRQEHDRIPFGQPNIIGRGDIYKQVNRYYEKASDLVEAAEAQENRVDMLEKVEQVKSDNELLKDVHVVGKTAYASIGAKTSVNNLDYFKHRLEELEQENEAAKAYNKTKPIIKRKTFGTEITKLKRKIANLEAMQEKDQNKVVSAKAQRLIDSGAVNQWQKKPIYYFVKGLRKVALEIDENGNFFVSSSYPAWSESDETFVENLLK